MQPNDESHLESPEEIAALTRTATHRPFSAARRLETARDLARTLAVAETNAALYPPAHPAVVQSIDELVAAANAIIALGFEEVVLNVYKNTLFIEDDVLPEESVTYRKLIEDLLARGASAVTLREGFDADDAMALAALLGEASIGDIAMAQAFLRDRGANAIELSETAEMDSVRESREREAHEHGKNVYDEGLALMSDVEQQAKLGKVADVAPLQQLVTGLLDVLFSDPAAVLGLSAIKSHDDYTLNHSINVCVLSLSLGSALGLDAESLKSLGLSALLYDLGKVRVPEEILGKPGPLTADEWKAVKTHSAEGADLLERIQLVDRMPMIVAYEHHQREDLLGYPESTTGEGQHLFSKIVAICDAYDAMTTSRPFRPQIRPDKALAVLMQGRDKAYDGSLTKAFVAMLGIYPMGAVVTLTDSSIAVVFRVNDDDLLRPRVKRLIDPEGRWLDEPQLEDLRLIDPDTGSYSLSIKECVPSAQAGVDDVWQYL